MSTPARKLPSKVVVACSKSCRRVTPERTTRTVPSHRDERYADSATRLTGGESKIIQSNEDLSVSNNCLTLDSRSSSTGSPWHEPAERNARSKGSRLHYTESSPSNCFVNPR